MIDLLMMVPSRNRPASIERLRKAWAETVTGNSKLVVLVDDDDENLQQYVEMRETGVDVRVGPRLRIGGTLNAVAPELALTCFAIGFMGDDHMPRTLGWDERFVDALRSTPAGIVYGNDLYHGENLPTAVAMTSNIVTTLGYFSLPNGVHLFLDNFWLAIGKGLDSAIYLDDVVLEHLHPNFGKAGWDDTYAEANAASTWSADEATYNEYVATQLTADLEKLRALQ
jgi:hypothetical protein